MNAESARVPKSLGALTSTGEDSELRLHRVLFDAVDEGVCVIDRLPVRPDGRHDYRYLAMNRAMREMFGIGDLTGQSIRDNFPDEVEAWYDDYDQVLETGRSMRLERESVPQGKYLEMFITRLDDADQDKLLIVMQDISARKQAEAILLESQQRQEFLLRFSDTIRPLTDPVQIATTATRLVAEHFQVNRCFISRIARDEGKAWIEHEMRSPGLASVEGEVNLADFPEVMRIAERATMVFRDVKQSPELSDRDREALAGLGFGAFIAAVLRQGERNYFWDLVIASTEPRNWTTSTAPLLEELAERTWIAIERARAEKVLLQTEKLAIMGRLASSIAHEINNPLEAVTNLLYLMGTSGLSKEASQYLEQAQAELTRVSHIAVETLRFSRRNSNPTQVRLSDLIDSVLNLHDGKLKTGRVKVELRYRPQSVLVCFPNEVRQVIANLIGNALDSMMGADEARLCLRVRNASSPRTGAAGVRLTVADSGSGMSAATLARIWEPFFTTKSATGTGLGLWVTLEIVHKHNGAIAVRSSTKPRNHGSIFSVFLPHLDERSEAGEA